MQQYTETIQHRNRLAAAKKHKELKQQIAKEFSSYRLRQRNEEDEDDEEGL